MNLNKNQQTEYNTIIFASLLQDVGKLLEKRGESLDYEHFRYLIIKNNIDVEPELLEMLHHINCKTGEYPGDRNEVEREEIKIKAFAAIIKNAYRVSKGRRFDDKDEDIHTGENENLLSIFSLLKIGKSNREPSPKYYSPDTLSPHSIFPVFKDKLKPGKFNDNVLISELAKALKAIVVSDFNELFNGCWNLLRKYLWSIPLSTIDAGEPAALTKNAVSANYRKKSAVPLLRKHSYFLNLKKSQASWISWESRLCFQIRLTKAYWLIL